jgi:hypothetical protein
MSVCQRESNGTWKSYIFHTWPHSAPVSEIRYRGITNIILFNSFIYLVTKTLRFLLVRRCRLWIQRATSGLDVASSYPTKIPRPNAWFRSQSVLKLIYTTRYNSVEQHHSWGADCHLAFCTFPAFFGTRRFIIVFVRAHHWALLTEGEFNQCMHTLSLWDKQPKCYIPSMFSD